MSNFSPGNLTRLAVISLLQDNMTGFNPTYAANVAQYQNAPAMTLDFSPSSQNVLAGDMDIVDVLESGTFKLPLMMIWAKNGVNTNLQKFQHFAGRMECYIRIAFGGGQWSMSRVPKNVNAGFETWPDAIEHTMLSVFHNPAIVWNPQIIYNGDMSWERSAVVKGGSNWAQYMLFRLSFDLAIA